MTMMGANRLFVDTNIFVYATDPNSPLQRIAADAIQAARSAGVEIVISPQILREYLAAATRVAAAGSGSALDDILHNFRTFRLNFTVLQDKPDVLNYLDTLVTNIPVAGKQIHDANIVATMQANNISHLLTHNTSDFARFGHLIVVVPLVRP